MYITNEILKNTTITAKSVSKEEEVAMKIGAEVAMFIFSTSFEPLISSDQKANISYEC